MLSCKSSLRCTDSWLCGKDGTLVYERHTPQVIRAHVCDRCAKTFSFTTSTFQCSTVDWQLCMWLQGEFWRAIYDAVSKDVISLSKSALAKTWKSILAEGFDAHESHLSSCTVLTERKCANLGLNNAHTFISIIFSSCYIDVIGLYTHIRANMAVRGQIRSDMAWLWVITHTVRYT